MISKAVIPKVFLSRGHGHVPVVKWNHQPSWVVVVLETQPVDQHQSINQLPRKTAQKKGRNLWISCTTTAFFDGLSH